MVKTARSFDVDLTIPASVRKEGSVFYFPQMLARIRRNAEASPWGHGMRSEILDAAAPWLAMDDDALWALMFSPSIMRAWQVWATGYCPACRAGVPMYNWVVNAIAHPWKVQCPHCREFFPKNDFSAYHRSGLDAHGLFDDTKADRSLLFNSDHPDVNDPKRRFGVDDGHGYHEDGHCWWFIGAYLIYGQWKQLIVGGAHALALAHVVTGALEPARKAAILLDRVADLYPSFDHAAQAIMHDEPATNCNGYVSTWHDACCETRILAMAYDMIFDAIRSDRSLHEFLAEKARLHGLSNSKRIFADIQTNIEHGLLRDPLANRPKIMCNYPQTDLTIAILTAVLGWPGNREKVYALADWILHNATHTDGTTGEKGMTDYSAFACWGLALFLSTFDRMDPEFLPRMLALHPALRQTFRLHLDTWCLGKYYPSCGDAGGFALQTDHYIGAIFYRRQGVFDPSSWASVHAFIVNALGLTPSMHSFFLRLHELTGDVAYAQLAHQASVAAPDGFPFDLASVDPASAATTVQTIVSEHGAQPALRSVNKQEWCLAILRSGTGENARALWLDYDTGGFWHGHTDGMNLGLFAKGLDLLPDFGYPPLQFDGGYGSAQAGWYGQAAAHNTVVVDHLKTLGHAVPEIKGTSTLFADGDQCHIARASGPALMGPNGGTQFERTAMLVDMPGGEAYVVDVFRVIGGRDHAKFVTSHFGTVATEGLTLLPAEDYGGDTLMRNTRSDALPAAGWSVDWTIEDRMGYLPAGTPVHFRHTDLSSHVEAALCETWVAMGVYDNMSSAWIPRIMVRRRGPEGLASAFVSVCEVYGQQRAVTRIRRLSLATRAGLAYGDMQVGISIEMADGHVDWLILADTENPLRTAPDWTDGLVVHDGQRTATLAGEVGWVRWAPDGTVARMGVARGELTAGAWRVQGYADSVWIECDGGRPHSA